MKPGALFVHAKRNPPPASPARSGRKLTMALICWFGFPLLLGSLFIVASGLQDDLAPADVALVLGSAVKPSGEPSLSLQARLDEAVALYRQGYFKTAIVSGGVGQSGFDEALVMKAYLAGHGLPPESVIEDHHGENTYASARNTALFLKDRQLRSVLVVSQYFHLPRARLALSRFGVPVIHTAHAQLFELRDLYSVPREVGGWIIYALRPYDHGRLDLRMRQAFIMDSSMDGTTR
jgi:uncharacterized SAM-binding protein YcdF (DUF218 family)